MEIKTLKNALERLAYTTSNEHKCNDTDKIALNKIIDFVNQTNEKVFNENQLYCKLYADALRENFIFYECIDIANDKLNRTLKMELPFLINQLKESLNTFYFENYITKKGIKDVWLGKFGFDKCFYLEDLKRFFEANKSEILKISEENKEIFKNIPFEEFIKSFEIYTYDEVFELFKINATLSFNQFRKQYVDTTDYKKLFEEYKIAKSKLIKK